MECEGRCPSPFVLFLALLFVYLELSGAERLTDARTILEGAHGQKDSTGHSPGPVGPDSEVFPMTETHQKFAFFSFFFFCLFFPLEQWRYG